MNDKKVTIYTTPTCTYCRMAKDFFQTNKITYEEHDVGTDLERRKEMVDKSGQMGVPVICFANADGSNQEVVIGFDKVAFKKALGL